jgi:hypothetical protein
MTLLEPLMAWWHRVRLSSEGQTSVVPIERNPPRVPDEYASLYEYLERRHASIVVLTFEQMEALLGFPLPAPARTERDWWTGAVVPTHRQSAAWAKAGRVATPNLSARTVMFER